MPGSMERPVFVFMDSLPTVFESVICICTYAPSYGSQKQKSTVQEFSLALHDLWSRAFTVGHVITLKNIRSKLDKCLKSYRNQVQKRKGNRRTNVKNWKAQNSGLLDILKPTSDPHLFDDDEKNFYFDQKNGDRRMALSDQVDTEFENLQDEMRQVEQAQHQQFDNEIDFILDDTRQDISSTEAEGPVNDLQLQQSQHRSGLVRTTRQLVNTSSQTVERESALTPSLRLSRNFLPKIKSAIATTSSRAGITIEQARRAFQASAEVYYNEQYYLSVDDVPSDSSASHEMGPSTPKRPRSAADYQLYHHVLPSARVISREKHIQAIQSERNCALAILDTEESDKVTIHYDTTTRRRIKGEWTSLIVNFSSGLSFRLRPLSLAVENRENITKLLVEQLHRLSEAGNTTSSALWERVTSLMTDSVSKNLHIEESVAASLNSRHIPFHLLCVSHTCEVFDKGNLSVLRDAEQKLDLRTILIARMPALKSFLSSSKSVVLVALEAFQKLVSNDGHKSSLWEHFDKELCDAGKSKKHSQFRERRFAKLGYTAATVMYHLEDYQRVLEKTKSNNQLVQACRIYINCEFILMGLKVLAWFTYNVTLPFLNMVEKATQAELLQILPQLHKDLAAQRVNTLSEFHVTYSFQPEEPTSAVEKHLLGECCIRAAADLALQRGREYGFGAHLDLTPRATSLNALNDEELEGLPTNNLDCERDLAKFDKLAARSASCSNRKFTGKGIRDEMTVHKSSSGIAERVSTSLVKVLDAREAKWVLEQDELMQERLQKSCDAALKAEEYVHVLLHKCKSWGGPVTTVDELERLVKNISDESILKNILRTEVSYRRHTSQHDFQTRSHLYKLNQISVTDLKINLTLILTSESDTISALPDMPTEEDMRQILNITEVQPATSKSTVAVASDAAEPDVAVNEPCVVIWDVNDVRQWYLGICQNDNENGTYIVEHLERCDPNNGLRWRYPKRQDIQTVSVLQIIPCNIIGSWDLSKRIMTFVLDNYHTIDALFKSFY